ncbi:NAD-dependent epimerase/dehydratase family protein [Alkalihalobacillus deserti]|uniref:NAD-dependent epimerase/dehydratase family protein n=1 Tax=Alkalihalobacillus deserti TaxID=2879466 RepID=UPI001D136D02|nr:NAD(P)-dependent oxidoreductase [Alkalihalobacillus deserti]
MNVLITGATGYVGRNLIFALTKMSHTIGLLVRDMEKANDLFGEHENIKLIDQNVNLLKTSIEEFNPKVVIHLATHSTSSDDYENMRSLINTNILYSTEILDALKNCQVRLFINTGTFAEYYYSDGNLESAYLYAATKTAFRSILDYYKKIIGFNVINVIPYTIYGENDTRKKVFHYLLEALDSPSSIHMTAGEQILDLIYIDDVVDFFITILNNINTLSQFTNYSLDLHLGTGIGTSIKELTNYIETITNKKANIHWGAKPYRKFDIMYAVAPISKNIELLGWRAKTPLVKGLQKLIETYNN